MSLKMVRIDVVGGVPTSMGDKVVRFTFNDFTKSYSSLDAFPSEEVLIRDATAGKGFIATILAENRGKMGNDSIVIAAEKLNNWAPLWVDTTLTAV